MRILEMDERKSRRYAELVEKVKQKYRNHPVCTDKLKLGWCDLLPGEDLCQEINLWTYWQGWGYATHKVITLCGSTRFKGINIIIASILPDNRFS